MEGPAGAVVVERGRRYDPRALLAFAYGKATGTPLTGDDIPADAADVLARLEFKVISPEDADRPAAKRPTRTSTPRTSTPRATRQRASAPRASAPTKREPVVALCPTCMTQLPANGRCDWCD